MSTIAIAPLEAFFYGWVISDVGDDRDPGQGPKVSLQVTFQWRAGSDLARSDGC